jgi:hypothetical protein
MFHRPFPVLFDQMPNLLRSHAGVKFTVYTDDRRQPARANACDHFQTE